jgi:hypothetical protein
MQGIIGTFTDANGNEKILHGERTIPAPEETEIANDIVRGAVFTDGEEFIKPRYAVIQKYLPAFTDAWGNTVKAGVVFTIIRTYAGPGGKWSKHTWNLEDFRQVFKPLPEEE